MEAIVDLLDDGGLVAVLQLRASTPRQPDIPLGEHPSDLRAVALELESEAERELRACGATGYCQMLWTDDEIPIWRTSAQRSSTATTDSRDVTAGRRLGLTMDLCPISATHFFNWNL